MQKQRLRQSFWQVKARNKGEIRKNVAEHYYKLEKTIDQMEPSYRFDKTCQGVVPQAIEAFLESESFEDALRIAISLGRDSDIIACIT